MNAYTLFKRLRYVGALWIFVIGCFLLTNYVLRHRFKFSQRVSEYVEFTFVGIDMKDRSALVLGLFALAASLYGFYDLLLHP